MRRTWNTRCSAFQPWADSITRWVTQVPFKGNASTNGSGRGVVRFEPLARSFMRTTARTSVPEGTLTLAPFEIGAVHDGPTGFVIIYAGTCDAGLCGSCQRIDRDVCLHSHMCLSKEHRFMSDKWDHRFLELADCIAKWSKDPDRGVGCVIASPDRRVCATGFNGLPSGVEDHPDRLARPAKYDLMCHAEANAIVQCARHGISPIGATIYCTFFPCIQCAIMIVQAGLSRVVSRELGPGDEHWAESIAKSQAVFTEAGISWEMM